MKQVATLEMQIKVMQAMADPGIAMVKKRKKTSKENRISINSYATFQKYLIPGRSDFPGGGERGTWGKVKGQ